MACRLFCAKPLPGITMDYCQFDPQQPTSEKLESKYNFSLEKMHWKDRLQNVHSDHNLLKSHSVEVNIMKKYPCPKKKKSLTHDYDSKHILQKLKRNISMTNGTDQATTETTTSPQTAISWGPHEAHLGPVGPRWAPCGPHEPCYQGHNTSEVPWMTIFRLPLIIWQFSRDDTLGGQGQGGNMNYDVMYPSWRHKIPSSSEPHGLRAIADKSTCFVTLHRRSA